MKGNLSMDKCCLTRSYVLFCRTLNKINMKTITIKQPWAQFIAEGIKDIENRTWKTNFRGRVLIHASADERLMNIPPNSFLTEKQIQNSLHMNVLSDEDLIKYLTQEQVYCTKTITDINLKPTFEAKKVYKIETVKIERPKYTMYEGIRLKNSTISGNEKNVRLIDNSNAIVSYFILDCSDFEMYAKFKHLFIPISELYEAYQHS